MTTATKPMYAAPGRRALLNDRIERCTALHNEVVQMLGTSEPFHMSSIYAGQHHRLEANRDAELDRLRRELLDLRHDTGAELARTHECDPVDPDAQRARLQQLKVMANERAAAIRRHMQNWADQGDWRAFCAYARDYVNAWLLTETEMPL